MFEKSEGKWFNFGLCYWIKLATYLLAWEKVKFGVCKRGCSLDRCLERAGESGLTLDYDIG